MIKRGTYRSLLEIWLVEKVDYILTSLSYKNSDENCMNMYYIYKICNLTFNSHKYLTKYAIVKNKNEKTKQKTSKNKQKHEVVKNCHHILLDIYVNWKLSYIFYKCNTCSYSFAVVNQSSHLTSISDHFSYVTLKNLMIKRGTYRSLLEIWLVEKVDYILTSLSYKNSDENCMNMYYIYKKIP
jgi:hypothetical protein